MGSSLPLASASILLLAFLLRVLWLGMKPAHFDEGVNGFFVDQMTHQGFYHYDPENFHGPLHFYILFIAQTLFGRGLWVLRMPIVLVSTGCVALALAYARFLPRRAVLWAALAMAISPGMVFYGRDAIHESWMVFFDMLAVWGILGLGQREETGDRAVADYRYRTQYIWAFVGGMAGMILTKETYVIHFAVLGLAYPSLLLLNHLRRPAGPELRLSWPCQDDSNWQTPLLVALGVLIFFYTGGLLDWSSLQGFWLTFGKWFATGTHGDSGHEKAWWYWFLLLGRYERTAAVGLFLIPVVFFKKVPSIVRYLLILACGTLAAYSLIPYKTPWCILSIIWPLFFVFGWLANAFWNLDSRLHILVRALIYALLGATLARTCALNFRDYDKESEEYVYVQTMREIRLLLDPLQKLVRSTPANYHLPGHILIPEEESHPLPWLLGDFSHIDYLDKENPPAEMDAAFIVAEDSIASEVDDRIKRDYFVESFLLRGTSGQFVTVYFDAEIFREIFPGRKPDRKPRTPSESGRPDDKAAVSDEELSLAKEMDASGEKPQEEEAAP